MQMNNISFIYQGMLSKVTAINNLVDNRSNLNLCDKINVRIFKFKYWNAKQDKQARTYTRKHTKHAMHVSTQARKHSKHVSTQARKHAKHVSTQARKHASTQAHKHAKHANTQARQARNLADSNKCSGSCNNISDPYARICISDAVKNLNLKLFNLMTLTNETRHISGMRRVNAYAD